MEVRWVPDNSGMRVGLNKEKNEMKETTKTKEEKSKFKQNSDELDEAGKTRMDRVETKAKKLELDKEDL